MSIARRFQSVKRWEKLPTTAAVHNDPPSAHRREAWGISISRSTRRGAPVVPVLDSLAWTSMPIPPGPTSKLRPLPPTP